VVSELLSEVDVFPVCSPELLHGEHPLREPGDLKYHTLIHDGFPIDWATWLERAGVTGINANSGVRFDSATYATDAAVHGEGVLLGRSTLVSADLAAGRLVRPFDLELKASSRYYVVYLASALRQRKVKAFRDWLLAESAAERGTLGRQ
jgi:LysR family transcriptional regulator, glycine cleavage system transcriptional activator